MRILWDLPGVVGLYEACNKTGRRKLCLSWQRTEADVGLAFAFLLTWESKINLPAELWYEDSCVFCLWAKCCPVGPYAQQKGQWLCLRGQNW
jgi:hypothetical protein